MNRATKLFTSAKEDHASIHPDMDEAKGITYVSLKKLSKDEKAQIPVSRQSVYADNLWEFTSEYPQEIYREVTLNFTKLTLLDGTKCIETKNSTYLEIYKDFAYTLISDPPPSRPKWSWCVQVLERRGFSWLIRYMAMKHISVLSDLTQIDFSNFLEWVASIPNVNVLEKTLKSNGNVFKTLDASHANFKIDKSTLSNAALGSRTKGLNWLFEQREKMPCGIKFDPWKNFKNASTWSDDTATKLIPRGVSRTPEMPDNIAAQLLQCALFEIANHDRYVVMAEELKTYSLKYFQSTGSQHPLGFPWHDYGYQDYYSTKLHRSDLIASAYIIVSLLTGMRGHEVLSISSSMQKNWSEIEQNIDGVNVIFYFVNSQTSKLHPERVETAWQTVPIVRQALLALSRINAEYIERGSTRLFSSPWKNSIERGGGSMRLTSINTRLCEFAKRHSITVDGEPYQISTHQFRKKFARILCRQGLGIKELQDQLKHFDVEMTRRYGEPNLYAELQQERFEVSKEIYEELLVNQIPVIGGGALEFEQAQKEFLGKTRIDREMFLDQLARSAVIDQVDDGLCMYNAKHALCGGEKVNCKPAHCLNSLIPLESAKKNLITRKRENERLLKIYVKQPLKIAHINSQLEMIDVLLTQASSKTTLSTQELKNTILKRSATDE